MATSTTAKVTENERDVDSTKTSAPTDDFLPQSIGSTTTLTTSTKNDEILDISKSPPCSDSEKNTTPNPKTKTRVNIIEFAKQLAEVKFRLGLSIMKHFVDNISKSIGNLKKKLNREE